MLTILAPKLNHPYVLQDQMVPVGVCLQALCMRSVAAFQTKAEYFNSPRRRWGINGKRPDFIGSWAAKLHSTTILCTFTWCIWGPRNSDMCLTCSVFLVGLWRTLGRKTSTWAPGSGAVGGLEENRVSGLPYPFTGLELQSVMCFLSLLASCPELWWPATPTPSSSFWMQMKTEKKNFLGASPPLCSLYMDHKATNCKHAKNAGLFTVKYVK